MPPLLGRFSTTKVVPIGLVMACAMMRATVSVGPGAYGTSRVMGLFGYCADARPAKSAATSVEHFRNVLFIKSTPPFIGSPSRILRAAELGLSFFHECGHRLLVVGRGMSQ